MRWKSRLIQPQLEFDLKIEFRLGLAGQKFYFLMSIDIDQFCMQGVFLGVHVSHVSVSQIFATLFTLETLRMLVER